MAAKTRDQLTAAEVEELLTDLERRLDGVGVETQPQVALKILELVGDPNSGMNDYAGVIRNDQALSGRLLRIANSAYFAQRGPVTDLLRAAVLLGVERIRAVVLGFYLSKAAASDPAAKLSRAVWGQSVYRACLSAELAKACCKEHVSEAYVIGLMLDAGLPLMPKFVAEYDPQRPLLEPPTKVFRSEMQSHPMTHVDVIAALCRRWKLPPLLAKPISWHHIVPPESEPDEPEQILQRIAYYVGAVQLGENSEPTSLAPMQSTAERLFGLDAEGLRGVVRGATEEYQATSELFKDVADDLHNLDALSDRVQVQLVEAMDDAIAAAKPDQQRAPEQFRIGQSRLQVRGLEGGGGTVLLVSAAGEPIARCPVEVSSDPARAVIAALGLEPSDGDDLAAFTDHLRGMAA